MQPLTLCFILNLKNIEDLEKYQNHPEHVKVAEFIAKVREDRIVVDYTA